MITLSPKAIERIEQFIEKDPKLPCLFRIIVRGQDQDGFIYEFLLQKAQAQLSTDHVFQTGTFSTVVDEGSYFHLQGAIVDWVDSVRGSSFVVNNPNKPFQVIENPTFEIIKEFVDKDINPAIAQHRGYTEVVQFEDNKVYVKMGGGCQGCSSASITLRLGIEERIKTVFPSVKQVIDTTDHASGTAPYDGHAE